MLGRRGPDGGRRERTALARVDDEVTDDHEEPQGDEEGDPHDEGGVTAEVAHASYVLR